MKLNIDLTELHKAASKMTEALNPSIEDAFNAGECSVIDGGSIENCHFSYFNTPELTKAWEQGKAQAESQNN